MTEIRYIAALFVFIFASVSGHGRLMDPPARNSMWRFGYPNPVNYNDNELFCGGFVVHAVKNKGKCGACGDDYRDKAPRAHENGGLYGNAIISKRYQMGQDVDIEVDLTTNHKGSMKLELCVMDDGKPVAEACFQNLPLADGSGKEFVIPKISKKKGIFAWKVKLPDGVVCSQCIMRWTYKAGNNWEKCKDGTSKVGCGDQETFINCADIVITTNTPHGNANPWQVWVTEHYPGTDRSSSQNAWTRNELKPLIVRHTLCVPKDQFAHIRGLDTECIRRCLAYPPTHCFAQCRCVDDCTAIGVFSGDDGDFWCRRNCLRHPSNCPKEKCNCV